MKLRPPILLIFMLSVLVNSCSVKNEVPDVKIVFLHHSTGRVIWDGSYTSSFLQKLANRLNNKIADKLPNSASVPNLFKEFNKLNDKYYSIKEVTFPKTTPYGWNNYPFDYYNIWVKNAGEVAFKEEPTLEILTKEYDVIIFKHCFPVSNILSEQEDAAQVNSEIKTIENYKLQYQALLTKLHEFPDTKFVLFTGAAQVKSNISENEALRAKEFFTWVIESWNLADDNVYIWDFYQLQTEGGLYFKDEYAVSSDDSHPNNRFAEKAAKLLFNRVIDVIDSSGTKTHLTGKKEDV